MAGSQDIVWSAKIDDKDFLDALDRMIKASEKFEKDMILTGKVSEEAFEALGAAAKELGNDVANLEKEMNETKAGTKAATVETGNYFKRIREGIRDTKVWKFTIGELVDKLKQKQETLKGVNINLKGFGNTAKTVGRVIKTALITSGIGALLAILGALYLALTRSEKGMNKIKQVVAALGAAFNVLVDRSEKVLGAFQSFFKGNFREGFKQLGDSVRGVTTELVEEAKAAYALAKAFQELERSQEDLTTAQLALRPILNKNRELAKDETKTISERVKALEQNLGIETVLFNERVALAQKNLDLVKEEQGARSDSLAKQKAINAANLELIEAQEARDAGRRAILEEIANLQKERIKRIKEEKKELDKLNKAYEKLARQLDLQADKAAISQAEGLEKLALQRDLAIKQTEEFVKKLREAAKAVGKILTPEQEADIQSLFDIINSEYEKARTEEIVKQLKEQIEKEEELLKEREEIKDATYKREMDFVKQREEIQLAELALIEEGTDETLTLEEEKAREVLRIRRQALTDQLALAKEYYGPDSQEVQLLNAQLQAIEAAFRRAEIGTASILDRIKDKILETFGIDAAQASFLVGRFSEIFQSIQTISSETLKLQIEQSEQLIEATQTRIDELETQLQKEQELKEQGLANDVQNLTQALAEENAALASAEAQRLQLEKKAANQRLVVDSIQQASQLALAAAKVITAESSKGLIGIITATAGLALLFSIFASAKANAAQFSSPTRLEKGGVLEGPSHAEGGIPVALPGESASDNYSYEAEGGEMVVNKKTTQKHLEFLKELNRGKFDEKEKSEFLRELAKSEYSKTGVELFRELAKREYSKEKVDILRQVAFGDFSKNEVQLFKELAKQDFSREEYLRLSENLERESIQDRRTDLFKQVARESFSKEEVLFIQDLAKLDLSKESIKERINQISEYSKAGIDIERIRELAKSEYTTERHAEFLADLFNGTYKSAELEEALQSLAPKRFKVPGLKRMARNGKRDPLRYKIPEIKRLRSQYEKANAGAQFKSLEAAIFEAQDKGAEKIIQYLKTRPIDTPLAGGIIREYERGAQKVREVIESKQ